MKRRQTRKKQSTRRHRHKGGANNNSTKVDCEAEGFSLNMRYATFGREYEQDVFMIHADGEKWSFDKLVDFTMNGRIIDWYIVQLRKQGIEYTNEDIVNLKTNKTLQILGAFFHRYKIVAERLRRTFLNLNGGVYHFLPITRLESFKGINSYKKALEDSDIKLLSPSQKEKITRLLLFVEKDLAGKDIAIEQAIDRAQCLMFYIVKHKGLPPGFVMDERISKRAREPIMIVESDYDLKKAGILKLEPTLNWLAFLEREYNELQDPPVTFGVF